MKINDYIKHWEGFSNKYYFCPSNKLTIGYGRNVTDNPISYDEYIMLFPLLSRSEAMIAIAIEGISEYQSAKLLAGFVVSEIKYLMRKYRWFRELSYYRRMVILDMIYNLGLSDFRKFKKMIKALKGRKYDEASNEIIDSKYYIQVGERAECNAFIMRCDNLPAGFQL